MLSLQFLYFIIRKLVMGCGVVCGVHPTTSSKHHSLSKKILRQLLQQITANLPFLPQQTYRKFSTYLQQGESVYIIPVGSSVPSEQQIPAAIWQKWKILLYGLYKSDEAYKRSLGFEPRNEKQQLTTCQNNSENLRMLRNDSFHEAKGPTQYHSCFEQIQKDLNRTFDFKQETKTYFEKVLKRISNHFPTMGYTQGVNFVVGYMLIVGYSQSDAFWMFAHLAMNRKYLLLGLYEDGFPLAAVYTLLFKNLLKRYDYELYNHIYNVLVLDDSVWIFKWFITYFIYSFPLQTIKFVWDLVIEIGGVGLVYFALGLVMQLKQQFMMFNDVCDASEFLQSLKSLSTFNEYVKINRLVEFAYEIKLRKGDFDGIDGLKNSFYKEHFRLILAGIERQEKEKFKSQDNQTADTYSISDKDITHHLHFWYLKIIEERLEFIHKSDQDKQKKMIMPELLREDYQDLQKSIQLLEEKIIQNESIKLSEKNIKNANERTIQNNNYFQSLVNGHPMEPDFIKREVNHSQFENRAKIITKLSYDIEQQIDELQGESDSNNDEQLQVSEQYPISGIEDNPSQQPSINIESQQTRQYNPAKNMKINVLVSQLENCRKRNLRQGTSKANNIKIAGPQLRSGLSLAGQNILSNLSGTNSHYSSIQSNNAGFKPKRHKENNLLKYNNKNGKVRTEVMSQASHPSNSSEHQSSIDHRTEKDSLSGYTYRENKKQRPSIGNDLNYLQRKTQQELMITSHCPDPRKESDPFKDPVSQIQIFNGEGLFKKKKRTNVRNSVMTSLTQDVPGVMRAQSTANIKVQQPKHRTYNEEESLESIIELSTARKPRRQLNHPLDVLLCDIESVK